MQQKCRNAKRKSRNVARFALHVTRFAMNIFVLYGQTATGKTAKALELCDKENGEIINFDSRQIYKKLTIVTGKDLPKNAQFVKRVTQDVSNEYSIEYYEFDASRYTLPVSRLWLYDIIDPKYTFSSAEYVKYAEIVFKDILSRGKTPILVGGTGYYLRHLLFGIPEVKVKEDWILRKKLETKTVEELQLLLKKHNQAMFEEMNNSDRNNPHRLIRRIEIAQNGIPFPAERKEETLNTRLGTPITYLPFFHSSSDVTREKITIRVKQRIQNGAIEEVKQLLKEGYTKNDPGLNAIGYQQLIAYLNNEITLDEAKNQWITKEVQYAKRQKTYFKKYFPS